MLDYGPKRSGTSRQDEPVFMTLTMASTIWQVHSPVVLPETDTLAEAGESSPIGCRSVQTLLPGEWAKAFVAASKALDDLGVANGSV